MIVAIAMIASVVQLSATAGKWPGEPAAVGLVVPAASSTQSSTAPDMADGEAAAEQDSVIASPTPDAVEYPE
jgi:hypothetical protein